MVDQAAVDAPASSTSGMTIGSAVTSERQIWEAALVLVRRHGEDAARVAGREARKHERSCDDLGYVVWAWIARATAELIKPRPGFGELVH